MKIVPQGGGSSQLGQKQRRDGVNWVGEQIFGFDNVEVISRVDKNCLTCTGGDENLIRVDSREKWIRNYTF